MPVNACVARPVDRKERKWNHEAQAAVQTEWDKLRALPGGGAWDESQPRDLNKLLREAKAQGRTLHWGHVFDICVEKNSELPMSNKLRKYKGTVVFAGDNVKN